MFTGATGVSATMSVQFLFTIFARTSRYVLARSRYASPVRGKINSIGPPESRDVNGWCSIQPPSSKLICVGGTANKSSSLFTPSHDCRCTNAILGEYVRSLSSSFAGTGPTAGSVRCIRFAGDAVRFIRLPGGGGVARRLLIRALPAAVALRFVAFLIF